MAPTRRGEDIRGQCDGSRKSYTYITGVMWTANASTTSTESRGEMAYKVSRFQVKYHSNTGKLSFGRHRMNAIDAFTVR